MEFVIWVALIGGMGFMLWYGYNLLAKKPAPVGADDMGPRVQCHLCRREFHEREMISRDKMAGFVNYFCGDCIESLYNDYIEQGREQSRRRDAINLN